MSADWEQCRKPRTVSSPYPQYCIPPDDPAEFSFKVLVMGDMSVGKTSFISRFCDNEFRVNNEGTIGVDLKKRMINVDGKTIRLLVWDTAGQERYRTLTSSFFRGVTGVIILYDVTRESTFDHVTNWLDDIAVNVSRDVCKVMVGNKCDHDSSRTFHNNRVHRFAESFMFPFVEASAKTGLNVDEAFEQLTRHMLASYEKRMSLAPSLPPSPSHLQRVELIAQKGKGTFLGCSC